MMNSVVDHRSNKSTENNTPKDDEPLANELCEKALKDAQAQLHPLLRSIELYRLEKRSEFVQAFRFALEHRLARKLAFWKPDVQAVYRFDETSRGPGNHWDGSIHLLLKVPRLSNTLMGLGKKLDRSLVQYLKQLGWSRVPKQQSVLDVQQVTPNELRHGISYGAMFWAVHTVPVMVWPQNRWRTQHRKHRS